MTNNSSQPKSDSIPNALSPGKTLKKAREERGLSLDAVHEGTKIPLDVLRAMEEGYNVRTLTPFYLKGFYKIYATYLGVDVTVVIQDYKPEILPKHIKIEPKEPALSVSLSKIFTRQFKRRLVIGLAILIGIFIVFKVFALIVSKIHGKPKVNNEQVVLSKKIEPSKKKASAVKSEHKKVPVKVIPVAVEAVQPQVSAVPIAAEEKGPSQPVPPSSQEIDNRLQKKSVTLTVRAKKDCWLRVKADDDVVFQSTLRLGAVETWLADKHIEIAGKNLNFLEFELNGKMIGVLGREDRKATLLEVTKTGLKILK